jgi:hypothetical protein
MILKINKIWSYSFNFAVPLGVRRSVPLGVRRGVRWISESAAIEYQHLQMRQLQLFSLSLSKELQIQILILRWIANPPNIRRNGVNCPK